MEAVEIRRSSANYSATEFSKGTNDYNRFSLFELLAVHYGFVSADPLNATRTFEAASHTLQNSLKFPDLERVCIYRARPGQTERTAEAVNVLQTFRSNSQSGLCQGDVRLEWGDVVQVPEADHPISAVWQGLPEKDQGVLGKCLTRQVQITVKGQTTNLVLAPEFKHQPLTIFPQTYTARSPNFMVLPVLYGSSLLRASSDLSRVKVTRRDPGTGQRYEMFLDCTTPPGGAHGPDLWLRDGDVIEVPERP
jgi:hypothetical protein